MTEIDYKVSYEQAAMQRLQALKNAFSTIRVNLFPIGTPDIMDCYEKLETYMLQMYNDVPLPKDYDRIHNWDDLSLEERKQIVDKREERDRR